MNFKKTWKRGTEGFTLVELIVVIAILAILAGIAVPAYSGYIKKANQAADQQVLAAVNTAFAAAVLENGEDFNKVTSAKLTGSNNGEGMTINGVTGVQGVKNADYNTAFQTYLPGGAETKVLKNFGYVRGVGFVDPANSSNYTSGRYNGATLYFNQSNIDSVNNSTFGDIGAAGLMNKVDFVSGLAADLVYVDPETGNPNTIAKLLMENAAGMAELGLDEDELIAQRVAQMTGEEYAGMSDREKGNQAYMEILANNAVLQAAKDPTRGQSNEELLASMQSTDGLKTLLTQDSSAALSQAAMTYGMYTAYANSLADSDPNKASAMANLNDPAKLLTSIEDSGFQSYLKGETGDAAADLEGYLAAMEMINSSTSNTDAVSSVLVNGFTDPKLVEMLESLMG